LSFWYFEGDELDVETEGEGEVGEDRSCEECEVEDEGEGIREADDEEDLKRVLVFDELVC
jgi:hypothetical protein